MWFREKPHFDFIEKKILPSLSKDNDGRYRILIAACSTGEETYSYGCLFQSYTNLHPGFDYKIHSFDIDPVSVKKAKTAVYDPEIMTAIPDHYKTFFLKNENFWTIKKDIKDKCSFESVSLLDTSNIQDESFNFISCRNALIYFDDAGIYKIVRDLSKKLKDKGILILGHSDHLSFNPNEIGLQPIGQSVYCKTKEPALAQEKAVLKSPTATEQTLQPLIKKNPKNILKFQPDKKFDLIFIGSSTGGTQVLKEILTKLTPETPPILIVQHILPQYAESLAQNLAISSGLKLGKMEDGEVLKSGHIYLPRGDYHISVIEKLGALKLKIDPNGQKRHSQRPSVDNLFESAQQLSEKIRVISFILTGMGSDGAAGMSVTARYQSNVNIAQDESSCVVYGMPKAAMESGVVDYYGQPKQFSRLIRLIADLK